MAEVESSKTLTLAELSDLENLLIIPMKMDVSIVAFMEFYLSIMIYPLRKISVHQIVQFKIVYLERFRWSIQIVYSRESEEIVSDRDAESEEIVSDRDAVEETSSQEINSTSSILYFWHIWLVLFNWVVQNPHLAFQLLTTIGDNGILICKFIIGGMVDRERDIDRKKWLDEYRRGPEPTSSGNLRRCTFLFKVTTTAVTPIFLITSRRANHRKHSTLWWIHRIGVALELVFIGFTYASLVMLVWEVPIPIQMDITAAIVILIAHFLNWIVFIYERFHPGPRRGNNPV